MAYTTYYKSKMRVSLEKLKARLSLTLESIELFEKELDKNKELSQKVRLNKRRERKNEFNNY